MKAVILTKINEPLQVQELEIPVPGKGEILIRVYVAGVNYSDIQKYKGRYFNMPVLPLTLGLEVAGIVEVNGEDTNQALHGKRVVALLGKMGFQGGFAEYALAKEEEVIELPDNVSFEDGLAVPVQGLTAWFLLTEQARISSGDSIFIHAAAGGVGTIAIQLAKILGVKKVIAGASSEDKLTLAQSLGADVLINYSEPGWTDKIMAATEGKGVNIILSSAAGDIATDSLKILAPFGRLLVLGSVFSTNWTSAHIAALMGKSQSIAGFFVGSYTELPENYNKASAYLLELIAEGSLKIVSGFKYELNDAQQALDDIDSRMTMGKAALRTAFYTVNN
ncbi:quinone oxidoreductase family protein [Mucilaginibacter polytrichastri]|uniref:Enoyl reductase (ER) domain-containing protein n=1 Tax=Mucilaginibacter polytrichastri TaxID=1302689 RepID=A0A1Q5ZY44_9SPHI|nr:NADPH:quinone oxidoreductase family protein [Mucilaginibacter polytrichastri]OKS86683.1 hypothetical protein RG47T_2140 [Mucilaginibacter polytrichastri]SFS82120.1 NADPH2:quinone reductase [Mucilaginibacter polytrichastri]